MDEIEIQGKIYISAKRAAEITGYAKDYVGQLARGGKLPATRIGRAWYVELDAIRAHAGISEVSKIATSHNGGKESTIIDLESRNETEKLSSLNSLRLAGGRGQLLGTWNEFKYLSDESDLFPAVNKNLVTPRNEVVTIKRITHMDDIKHALVNEPTLPVEKQIRGVNVTERAVKPEPGGNRHTSHANFQRRKINPSIPITATFSLFAFIALPLASSLYVEWHFVNAAGSSLASASTSASTTSSFQMEFSLIFEYFKSIFDAGILLIQGFLNVLINSIAEFFNSGFQYIAKIINSFR